MVGLTEGEVVDGLAVGLIEGATEGTGMEGATDGRTVGLTVGALDGAADGGRMDGATVGPGSSLRRYIPTRRDPYAVEEPPLAYTREQEESEEPKLPIPQNPLGALVNAPSTTPDDAP